MKDRISKRRKVVVMNLGNARFWCMKRACSPGGANTEKGANVTRKVGGGGPKLTAFTDDSSRKLSDPNRV